MRSVVLILVAAALAAQQPSAIPADLRFEVASLKLSTDTSGVMGIRPAPGGQRYEARYCSIRLMIQAAFRLKPEQVTAVPEWFDTERYDMEAKAERSSSIDELHVMLMNMLVDRVHLRYHHEKKEMPIYALTLDKGTPKLTPHQAANGSELWIDQTSSEPLHVRLAATASSMDYFAFRLSALMDRPVVNQTNLPGGYDFVVSFTQEPPPGFTPDTKLNGQDVDTSGPTVYAALKQLGLEMKAGKGLADVIVIDHAEKPTLD